MKRIPFFLFIAVLFTACNSETKPAEEAMADTTVMASGTPATSTVTFPYNPEYVAFTDEVSDKDLLNVLNSYKAWETGDLAGVRSTLADSVTVESWSGFRYTGATDGLMKNWTLSRDSLSSVSITMAAWKKLHSVEKNEDWVAVWYTEVDRYKMGKVDSAAYQDVNQLKNGKIVFFAQHKQFLPKKK